MNRPFNDNEMKEVEERLTELFVGVNTLHSDFRKVLAVASDSLKNPMDACEMSMAMHYFSMVEKAKMLMGEALDGISFLRSRRDE